MKEIADEMSELTGLVIGAAIEVHRELGPGYTESVYEDALAVELELRAVKFRRQYEVQVHYKGHPVGLGRLDFYVDDCLVVELKAVEDILPVHKTQVLSYMRTVDATHGLLINFNVDQLIKGVRRLINK